MTELDRIKDFIAEGKDLEDYVIGNIDLAFEILEDYLQHTNQEGKTNIAYNLALLIQTCLK